MDPENFILRRDAILAGLAERRRRDLSGYSTGVGLPVWARWALSFATGGGVLSRVLELGLPLAIPLLLKKQPPAWRGLIQRFFPSKA